MESWVIFDLNNIAGLSNYQIMLESFKKIYLMFLKILD